MPPALPTGTLSATLHRFLPGALIVWVIALVATVLAQPQDLWVTQFLALPSLTEALPLALCVALIASPLARRRRTLHLALSATLAITAFGTLAPPLGDYGFWVRAARFDHAGASDLLSNAIYRAAFLAGGRERMALVAPAWGVLTGFVLLRVADRICRYEDSTRSMRSQRFGDLACVLGFWHFLYTRNYIENAQLNTPFLLLAIAALHRYPRGPHPRRTLIAGSAWLATAAAVHGQAIGLFPAIPLLIWLQREPRPTRDRWLDLGAAVGVVLGILGAAVGGLIAAGFFIYQGNAHGGIFVPLAPRVGCRYTLFGWDHLQFCGNALLLASPLVIGLPCALLSPAIRARLLPAARGATALWILALGYCGFSFVINFMLDFPRDADLLLAAGPVLHLALLRVACVLDLPQRRAAWFAMALGAALAIPVAAGLRIDPPDPTARLLVNGRSTPTVEVRGTERIVVEVRQPTGPYRVLARAVTTGEEHVLREDDKAWISRALPLHTRGAAFDIFIRTGAASSPPVRVYWTAEARRR